MILNTIYLLCHFIKYQVHLQLFLWFLSFEFLNAIYNCQTKSKIINKTALFSNTPAVHLQTSNFFIHFIKSTHNITPDIQINNQFILILFQANKQMFSNPQSNQHTRQADMRLAEIEKEIYKKIDIGHQIANLLNKQKKSPINERSLQTHQNNQKFTYDDIQRLEPPPFMHGVNYYDFVWKTFVKNQILIKQVKSVADKNKSLQNVITEIQRLTQEYCRFYKLKNRKKNHKNFTCPYENCHKIYGSDVSLNLHIKLKHNGGNKTDREKLAEQICQAQEKGEPMPQLTLNLPPGYLNEYKKLYFLRDLYNEGQIMMPQQHQYNQQQLSEQKPSKREKK